MASDPVQLWQLGMAGALAVAYSWAAVSGWFARLNLGQAPGSKSARAYVFVHALLGAAFASLLLTEGVGALQAFLLAWVLAMLIVSFAFRRAEGRRGRAASSQLTVEQLKV